MRNYQCSCIKVWMLTLGASYQSFQLLKPLYSIPQFESEGVRAVDDLTYSFKIFRVQEMVSTNLCKAAPHVGFPQSRGVN